MAEKARRILVVEDEYFLADDLKRALDDAGLLVAGPVGRVADALALLDSEEIDGAVLDINLHGSMVYPVARELRERDIPFLFITGYDRADTSQGFDDVELMLKSVSAGALMRAIGRLFPEQPDDAFRPSSVTEARAVQAG